MGKHCVRSLYKKLLCISAAIIMMSVILLPSLPVKAVYLDPQVQFFDTGWLQRSRNTDLYYFNYESRTLYLKGKPIHCGNRAFLHNMLPNLRIYVESDTTIYGGEIHIYANTKITGPGKLTIVPNSSRATLIRPIYVVNGSTLTFENAKVDVTAQASRGTCIAILGEGYRESLVIRNSVVSAKGRSAAIANFGGGISIQNDSIVFPELGSVRNGSIYATSTSNDYAKEVRISSFYVTQQPAYQVDGPVGDTVSFKVATSLRPWQYQWQRYNREKSRWEDVTFSGARTNRLTVTVTEDMYSWRFRCVLTYGEETLISNEANLRVVAKITDQPASQIYVNSGSTARLSVTTQGSIMRYTWQYYNESTGRWLSLTEGGSFRGVNTNQLTVKGNSDTQGMKFRCSVMNRFGYSVCTDGTTLNVRN